MAIAVRILLALISASAIGSLAGNSPELADDLEVLEECQGLFSNFLPQCDPCFDLACDKCSNNAEKDACKIASKEAKANDSCHTEVNDQIRRFVRSEVGNKCSFLEPPRKTPRRTRGLVSGSWGGSKTPERGNQADWMANLPEDELLSRITIPGTHESCALYGGPPTVCQKLSLTEQFNMGVRFVDIRARYMTDSFTIHHAFVSQNMVFGGVLDQCIEFLNNHPTETILMRFKQEYSMADFTTEVAPLFEKYRKERGYKGVFYGDKMYVNPRIPTLGEVRGKIVILSQVTGIDGIWWWNSQLQDDYEVPTAAHISPKWEKVKSHLEKAALDHARGSNDFYVNFASGSGLVGLAFPNVIARIVNKNLYSYLKDTKCPHGDYCMYGTIAMDFPGDYDDGVVDLLIKNNRRK